MKTRSLLISLAVLIAGLLTAPAASASSPPPYRLLMIRAINSTRARYGLPPVRLGRSINMAAQAHSTDMLNHHYFAHTSPSGSTLYTRLLRFGFVHYGTWSAGEAIGYGSGTYGSVWGMLGMWMRSSEHRAIILSRGYGWIGVGRAVGYFGGYRNAVVWTADLAHR